MRLPQDISRGSLGLSGTLHLLVILAIVLGLPVLFERKLPEETPIAVRLVPVAPETRATQLNRHPPKPQAQPKVAQAEDQMKPPQPAEPAKPLPPPPQAKPEEPPPPPKPPQPPKPEPPKPEPPKPEPPKPPEPKPAPPQPKPPEPKPEPPKPPPPRPEPKKEVAKQKPEQTKADFDALLKNLTRQKTAPAPPETSSKAKAQPAQSASSQPVAPLGAQLTASERDLVIQQIEQCWNPDLGARDARNVIVDVHVEVNPDGTVASARAVDSARYYADRVFQSAADRAVRAVRDPKCSPLKLPAGKYEEWKSMDLTFNPRDML